MNDARYQRAQATHCISHDTDYAAKLITMSSHTPTVTKTHDDYAVGWICALPKERAAATAMLDQRHGDLAKPKGDKNAYTLGSIGKHNVVIACLPKGRYGTNPAATVAAQMAHTFASIKFVLMVGIGGGIPPRVRLGDVVISSPGDQFPGVIQWDMGKAREGGKFERTGSLNNPPDALLTAMTAMEAEHDLNGSKLSEYLDELKRKWPRMAKGYLRSDALMDVLFKADYSHVSEVETTHNTNSTQTENEGHGAENGAEENTEDEEEDGCQLCDKTKIIKRKPRRKMRVHYGLIASGNQVIKDAIFRDKLNKSLGGNILCVEMEAAGLMTSVPCAIIRGICDYADSHKNKLWQKHAAAVAAAVAKELLGYVQPSDIEDQPAVKNILNNVEQSLEEVRQQVSDGFKETSNWLANLQSVQELENKKFILGWLSPIDSGLQQSNYITQREHGTAEWFLNSTEFQSWLETDNQTLFCPGLPGAGKTIQTSVVVNDLYNRFQNDPTVGIAYFYLNYRRHKDQKIEELLACLLRQLATCHNSLPHSVLALYHRHQRWWTRPSLPELVAALKVIVRTYSRTFVIIDALDECQDSDRSRTNLLTELFLLQKARGINLLATSRSIPEITEWFNGCPSLGICPSQDDIWHYLDRNMSLLPNFVKGNVDLQAEIKTSIAGAIEGVFVLAKLYMDSLVGARSPEALRKALKGLRKISQRPRNQFSVLYDAYEKAMQRIQMQQGDLPRDATIILSWIVKATRQLTVAELQHALAVEAGTEELNEANVPTAEHLVQACAPLVTIDKKGGFTQLIHYTAQEFFEQPDTVWFPNAHAEITRTCITYLSFKAFDDGCSYSKMESYKLYDYAARNWGHHAREASPLCQQEVIDFLQSEAKVEASSKELMMTKGPHSSWGSLRQITGLHLASYFGIQEAVEVLRGLHNVNSRDSWGGTPLMWAAEEGHAVVVKLLIDGGADVNAMRRRGRSNIKDDDDLPETALTLAVEKGFKEVIQLLLDGGADVNLELRRHGSIQESACGFQFRRDREWTAMTMAAEKGDETVVRLLLNGGGDVNAERSSKTEHHQWLHSQNPRYRDLQPQCGDGLGHSPHNSTRYRGFRPTTFLTPYRSPYGELHGLRPGRIQTRSRNPYDYYISYLTCTSYTKCSETALTIAVERGHEKVIKLLLDGGANPNAERKDSESRSRGDGYVINEHKENIMTALLLAVEKKDKKVVRLLLDSGADVNAKRKRSESHRDHIL